MTTKHTPGPWETEEEVFNAYENMTGIYVRHVESGRICQTFANCLVNTDEACRANARLIAAAPDLLEALTACVEALAFLRSQGVYVWPNHPNNPEVKALAAITKAAP